MSPLALWGRMVLYTVILAGAAPVAPSPAARLCVLVAGVLLADLERRLGRLFGPGVAFLTALALATSNPVLALASSDRGIAPLVSFLAGWIGFAFVSGARPPSARLARWGVAAVSLAPAIAEVARSTAWRVDPQYALVAVFGSPNGLLYATPLLWAAFFGNALMRRDHPATALMSWTAVAVGVLSLAAQTDGADGHPRVESWVLFLGPGLAWSLTRVRAFAARAPQRVVAAAAALLVGWNLLFMEQYRRLLIPADDTTSFARVTSNSARLLSRFAGTPSAWPANWMFARRFHTTADRWDAIGGRRLFADSAATSATVEIGDDETPMAPDAPLLLNGFGDRHTCEQGWCRDIDGAGRILLPLYEVTTQDLVVRVRARGRGVLRVSLNESARATAELNDRLADVVLRVPAPSVRRGINELGLSVDGGGKASLDRLSLDRVTGQTPKH